MPCSGGKQHSKCNGHELGTTSMNNDKKSQKPPMSQLYIEERKGERKECPLSESESTQRTQQLLCHLNLNDMLV
jgi:hypothetical protein